MAYSPSTSGPAPVAPISGLSASDDWASPEERYGGAADPRHANLGEVAEPYPWEGIAEGPHGPFGLDSSLLGDSVALTGEVAGTLGQDPTGDLQPVTRAAPWPKGVDTTTYPGPESKRLVESASIHASNMGASRELQYQGDAQNDQWAFYEDHEPGTSIQESIPDQLKTGGSGGWGSRDRVQSYAIQNEYGFDGSHWERRVAVGSIPGNFMWLQPGSRPMHQDRVGPAVLPVGQQSPFTGDNIGASFNTQGSILTDLPTEYAAPAEPALATSGPSAQVPVIEFW